MNKDEQKKCEDCKKNLRKQIGEELKQERSERIRQDLIGFGVTMLFVGLIVCLIVAPLLGIVGFKYGTETVYAGGQLVDANDTTLVFADGTIFTTNKSAPFFLENETVDLVHYDFDWPYEWQWRHPHIKTLIKNHWYQIRRDIVPFIFFVPIPLNYYLVEVKP